ncbi:hypothetical protein [Modestobacter altitudinis]|nr:hypothetical protein [Modestobacter altitudinis]
MTTTAPAPVSEVLDPAIALADALQSGFAAQRSGCQRIRTAR